MAQRQTKDVKSTVEAIEEKIVDYADQLGHILGSARARVDSWKGERQKMIDQLSSVVKDAQALLTDLGHQAERQVARVTGRRGRPAGSKNVVKAKRGPGRPAGAVKKRTMSAEARARIAAAQKARWASLKATAKK